MAKSQNPVVLTPTTGGSARRWASALTYALSLAVGVAAAWLLLGGGRPVTLAVHTKPPGANVFLDGQWRGVTPLALDSVPRGEHHLCLTKHGFARHVETLGLRRPLTQLVNLLLTRIRA